MPTIRLQPIDPERFETTLERAAAQYADEQVRAGRWSAGEAAERARKALAQLLPRGVNTPNHHLLDIVDDGTGEIVGTLWYAEKRADGPPHAYVYDIQILDEHRRRGCACAAFARLEERVREAGLGSIRLNVYGHNDAARSLYEKLGFEPVSIVMRKDLTRSKS